MFKREATGTKIWLIFVHIFIALTVVLMVLPLLNIVAVSLSSEIAVLQGRVSFWPVNPSLRTYRQVFLHSNMILALQNTIRLTIVGTIINLVMVLLAAYPLSKQWLKGRAILMNIIVFTMIFSAGMIPTYMLISNLGLLNSFWALWLPGALSTFHFIIMKSFIQNIPSALMESAEIDGASEFRILLQIVIPLSKAAIATIALFSAVGWWNSWFPNMMYIQVSRLITQQVQLRGLLQFADVQIFVPEDAFRPTEESIRAASIIIATLPILMIYPFLQKYFVKGVMIGSIKG